MAVPSGGELAQRKNNSMHQLNPLSPLLLLRDETTHALGRIENRRGVREHVQYE